LEPTVVDEVRTGTSSPSSSSLARRMLQQAITLLARRSSICAWTGSGSWPSSARVSKDSSSSTPSAEVPDQASLPSRGETKRGLRQEEQTRVHHLSSSSGMFTVTLV
jgi:hypothetical protein